MKPNYNGIDLVIDFHGVLADVAQAEIILQGGPPPFVEDVTRWDHPLFTNVWEDLTNPKLYEYMFPIYEAVSAMQGMNASGYHLTVATHQPPAALEYVQNWLSAYKIPFDDLILCDNKNTAGGHILVDDRPSNVQRYIDQRGPAVLFGQPWNKEHNRLIGAYPATRVVGWNRTLEAIRDFAWNWGVLPFQTSKASKGIQTA